MAGPGADRFGDEERAEVLEVLSSGHLSRYGDLADPAFKHKVYSLEQEFAEHLSVKHALATNSGTASLLISLLAVGIGPGDEVLVPGFTYVASIAAIVHARAVPVLVEVDESLTIDPADARDKITSRTRAVMAVHMLGNPCDMTALGALAAEHGLHLLEDVAQATGGSFGGQKLGTFGAMAAFSLNRYKVLAAGEGGLVVTDDDNLYERAFALHDQGHSPLRASKRMPDAGLIGLNFKMNELTGAVALAQLRKLDAILAALRTRKALLRQALPDLPGVGFRRLNDVDGECATMLTLLFDEEDSARAVAKRLGTTTLAEAGWHVYGHMSHVGAHRTPVKDWSPPARYAQLGALPRTDDLLCRSINISVGVVDAGLGAAFGITIRSTPTEIEDVAQRLAAACRHP